VFQGRVSPSGRATRVGGSCPSTTEAVERSSRGRRARNDKVGRRMQCGAAGEARRSPCAACHVKSRDLSLHCSLQQNQLSWILRGSRRKCYKDRVNCGKKQIHRTEAYVPRWREQCVKGSTRKRVYLCTQLSTYGSLALISSSYGLPAGIDTGLRLKGAGPPSIRMFLLGIFCRHSKRRMRRTATPISSRCVTCGSPPPR
jgi:hypothetical protein